MVGKLLPILLILLLLWFLFFHRSLPKLSRLLGRRVGDVKRAGSELLTDEEVPGSPLARYEAQIGKAITQRVLLENALSADLKLQERVARVGERLAAHAQRKKIHYRFAVIEDDDPNAFAIPGGFVFVTDALVGLCGGDDNRLAGVLGHEIAHIDRRHAFKSYASSAATSTGMKLLTLGRGGTLLGQVTRTVENLITSGFSRNRELEADRAGTEMASKAGFLPMGLVRLLEDMTTLEPPPSRPAAEFLRYFRSHPPLPERSRALQQIWTEHVKRFKERQRSQA